MKETKQKTAHMKQSFKTLLLFFSVRHSNILNPACSLQFACGTNVTAPQPHVTAHCSTASRCIILQLLSMQHVKNCCIVAIFLLSVRQILRQVACEYLILQFDPD